MKRLLCALLLTGGSFFAQSFFAQSFFAQSLFAQNLVGTWQGTLQVPQAPGGQLRVVMKVSTTDADTLKGIMYSIDQGGQPISASAVSLQGSAVKIAVVAIGGTFEGKLSADGNSIAGTWTQGPNPIPLTLARTTPQTAWTIPDPPPPPKLMPAEADPSFEVATIKLSEPNSPGKGIGVDRSGKFTTRNETLLDLITFAWGIHSTQVVGAPDWLGTARYEIVAKPDIEGIPNDKQVRSMMRKLITDRFKLTFHNDKKELTVYTIAVGKTGPKLTQADADAGNLPGLGLRGLGRAAIRNATMADFASFMQTVVVNRPVVDRTGLTAKYNFTLDWTPDETQFPDRQGLPPAPADPNAETFPDLFTAIQQQLGLKLESAKLPVDVLVIDHVEKPSAN